MRYVGCCVLVMLLAGVARGEDEIKPQDLKKLYNETLVQLKAAQDRKAELASQNERMALRMAELDKQVQALGTQLDDLRRQTASYAEKTYFLRTHYAVWLQFLDANPPTRAQWDLYVERLTPLTPLIEAPFFDTQWPLGK